MAGKALTYKGTKVRAPKPRRTKGAKRDKRKSGLTNAARSMTRRGSAGDYRIR